MADVVNLKPPFASAEAQVRHAVANPEHPTIEQLMTAVAGLAEGLQLATQTILQLDVRVRRLEKNAERPAIVNANGAPLRKN